MKKFLFIAVIAMFGFGNLNAQESKAALSEGSIVTEINTGSFFPGGTAFSLESIDGNTSWSVGAEGGYFLKENLAVKVGFGYSDSGVDGADGTIIYKIGVKYYVMSQFPVGVDFTGLSQGDISESYVGLQGGYAWFVAPNVSIEPALRYNMSLDEDKVKSVFQGLIGFAFHF